MVSYDEEDEDSDIFGESDRDNEEDDEDNAEVRPHLTLYLLRKPEIIVILMDFASQIQNAGPSSFAEELAARIKGDVVIKAEGDRACELLTFRTNRPFPSLLSVVLACSLSLCFLPCPAWEALASKKKSKGRKESQPSKLQGIDFIHDYRRRHRRGSVCCLALALHSCVALLVWLDEYAAYCC